MRCLVNLTRLTAGRRRREVHDLGEAHLEDGQEELHGRAADGGRINGVLAVRDGGDMEDGIRLR
jgi:hypothetical protein